MPCKLCIEATLRDEGIVVALLKQDALLKHHNHVRRLDLQKHTHTRARAQRERESISHPVSPGLLHCTCTVLYKYVQYSMSEARKGIHLYNTSHMRGDAPC